MNLGRVAGFIMSGLCIVCAVGYALVKDWRRAIYFALAAALNFTVVY